MPSGDAAQADVAVASARSDSSCWSRDGFRCASRRLRSSPMASTRPTTPLRLQHAASPRRARGWEGRFVFLSVGAMTARAFATSSGRLVTCTTRGEQHLPTSIKRGGGDAGRCSAAGLQPSY